MIGKCKDCKWWIQIDEGEKRSPYAEPGYKMCQKFTQDEYLKASDEDKTLLIDMGLNSEDELRFSPEYGCILFEVKAKS